MARIWLNQITKRFSFQLIGLPPADEETLAIKTDVDKKYPAGQRVRFVFCYKIPPRRANCKLAKETLSGAFAVVPP